MYRRSAVISSGLIVFGGIVALAHSSSKDAVTTDKLPAILKFIEQQHSDTTDRLVSDADGVLGSKEDGFTYRLRSGIKGARHENVKKFPRAKGWYYLGSLRDFGSDDRTAARAYAARVWAVLQPALEAEGFSFHNDNPWSTYIMSKPSGAGRIQVWLDYTDAGDGTHVTLLVSPNHG